MQTSRNLSPALDADHQGSLASGGDAPRNTGARTKATLGAFSLPLEAQIAQALQKSADLTAVERFSQWHREEIGHAHGAFYKDLLPASPPAPGQQYAFEVDLDKCSSCKACVVACHSLNGLDEGESWRSVGSLVGPQERITVTSSCHHCVDPGCASGCPTLAYQKDELTGIVKHLDDQCMGCQYCTWTCPYDAPKWNDRLGIVRKCDMCQSRLKVGEAPACVQACPSQAIRVVVVETAKLEADPSLGTVLPGIVAPQRTRPTTTYKGELPQGLEDAGLAVLRSEPPHTPLAILLVLTQWAAGLWVLQAVSIAWGHSPAVMTFPVAAALLLAGLGIGALHLGRPMHAWKAFLGWRRSWFSREVLAMGNAVPFALTASLPATWLPPAIRYGAMGMGALFLLAGVGCSAMLYIATPRPVWARAATAWRFAWTALGGGAIMTGMVGAVSGAPIPAMVALAGIAIAAKSVLEWKDAHAPVAAEFAFARQSALLAGPLNARSNARWALVGVALSFLALALATGWITAWILAMGAKLGADLVERELFFRACPATRMPGGC